MFSDILRTTGSYTDEEVRVFENAVTTRHVVKDETLLRAGQVAKTIHYLLSGSAYQYNAPPGSAPNIIDLHMAGEWFTNYESLIAQRPSGYNIRAFSDGIILEISLETVHYLVSKSIAFLQLNGVLEGAVARLKFFDQSMSPTEKYNFILEHRPGLIQSFPLKMIASYLKTTPETVSRIRRSIMRQSLS